MQSILYSTFDMGGGKYTSRKKMVLKIKITPGDKLNNKLFFSTPAKNTSVRFKQPFFPSSNLSCRYITDRGVFTTYSLFSYL